MRDGNGWPLADLWGVGPGQEKDKSGGRKVWENDIKEARTTERDRHRWEKEEGKTVRNLLEVERRSTGALSLSCPS